MILARSKVVEWVKALRQRYAGMKIIVGRDKLDEIQVRRTILDHPYSLWLTVDISRVFDKKFRPSRPFLINIQNSKEKLALPSLEMPHYN